MTTFNWSQPLRMTEKLSDALSIALMESDTDSGFVNIYRDEQEDFCGSTVFECKEEAISVGLSIADSYDNTILFKTNGILITSY